VCNCHGDNNESFNVPWKRKMSNVKVKVKVKVGSLKYNTAYPSVSDWVWSSHENLFKFSNLYN
jgi:hypothetical protein